LALLLQTGSISIANALRQWFTGVYTISVCYGFAL
jgi:hypothetical protein